MFKQANALAAWMVLGNAGALLLTVKAILDGTACDVSILRQSALAFSFGVLLTFSGMMIGFLFSIAGNAKLSDMLDHLQGAWIADTYIDELEEDGVPVPEDASLRQSLANHEAEMKSTHDQMKRLALVGVIAASVLTGAGSVSFAYGLLNPLLINAALERCAVSTKTPNPDL